MCICPSALRAAFACAAISALPACYLTPQAADTAAIESQTDAGGGTPTGPLDGLRGSIEDGNFAVYWRHYDSWQTGACVEVLLRNQSASSAQITELRLTASAAFTYWADAGGATFWPDGAEITIWPDALNLQGGGIQRMYYCAEPAAALVGLEVQATGPGSDTPAADTGAPAVNAGSFVQGPLVVTWRELWEDTEHGGTCVEFAAFNEGSAPLDLGVLRFEMSATFSITHYYGLSPTPLTDGMALTFPSYLGALPPIGEALADQFRGTVCLDPLAVPVSMTATID